MVLHYALYSKQLPFSRLFMNTAPLSELPLPRQGTVKLLFYNDRFPGKHNARKTVRQTVFCGKAGDSPFCLPRVGEGGAERRMRSLPVPLRAISIRGELPAACHAS